MEIRTKWHKVLDLVREGVVHFTSPPSGEEMAPYFTSPSGDQVAPHYTEVGVDLDHISRILQGCSKLPRFVFDRGLLELNEHNDEFHKSLIDMRRAGMLKLPFSELMVELPMSDGSGFIAYLVDRDFAAMTTAGSVPAGAVIGIGIMIKRDTDGEYVVLSPSQVGLDIGDKGKGPMVQIECCAGPWWSEVDAKIEAYIGQVHLKDGMNLGTAWFAVMLLMATRGVDKQVIDPVKLNRQRQRSNKTLIPRHTYIHIGHVYQRDGTAVKYDERKSPRPHWRRGHFRNVRFGVGRKEVRPTWIAPMLVSYHGDAVIEDLRVPDYVVSR